MVVTRQPVVRAAWIANPPQPVPISSTMVVGAELEPADRAIELRALRLLEGHVARVEDRRRVRERRIEEEREEVVAEVVVRRDVAPGAAARVAPQGVPGAQARAHDSRQARIEPGERLAIAREDADHRDEVVAAPQSVEVRLGAAERAAHGEHAVERGIVYVDLTAQRGAVVAEAAHVVALAQHELSVLDPREARVHGASRGALDGVRRGGKRKPESCGAVGHAATSRSVSRSRGCR